MQHAHEQQYEFPGFTARGIADGNVRFVHNDLDPHEMARIAEDRIIADAIAIIERRFHRGEVLSSPRDSADYFKLKLGRFPYEVFGCLLLDNRHAVLGWVELFRGTVNGTEVHAREVVRVCMEYNACAVIFSHQHPSGIAEPSAADCTITRTLRDALKLIDVRVIDHLVIGKGEPVSMAVRGLI
ncbi:JAB domain-containing protein [Rhodanobacter sp. FW021-MT20]|uniref:JAB domain-containing protein n=1 Tax=Rhodanobacter sp. FW021-MT20 TaxID=1162282 RepID=UPI003F74AC00